MNTSLRNVAHRLLSHGAAVVLVGSLFQCDGQKSKAVPDNGTGGAERGGAAVGAGATGAAGGKGAAGGATGGGGRDGAAGGTGTGGAGGAGVIPDPKFDPAIDGPLGPLGGGYEYRVHHPFRLTLDGPASSDAGTPNPFLDFRLIVTFKTPGGATFAVPGYFAGDGNQGPAGSQWRVHFNPPEVGSYTYTVSFRSAAGIAIDTDPATGSALAPDGKTGAFNIGPTDKQGPDFRATGKLAYVKQHYLRTIGDNKVWIKTGSNSPENMLGYAGFTNTSDGPAGIARDFLHRFAPHVADWKAGDPDWGGGKGKGIIGLMNYYAAAGVNSVNFMTLTLNGDGDDVVPFVSRADRQRFDNAKLQQWEIVASHAETRGIAIQDFLCETENCGLLGLNTNGKIYYREMVARFAHHGGVIWNIGEENNFDAATRKGIAAFLMAIDPYNNPVADHSHAGRAPAEYPPLMGDPSITATSIQDSPASSAGLGATFRAQSAQAGVPWVIMQDEQTPANAGVTDCPAAEQGNCDAIRKSMIWPFLLSGGGGFEWYSGYQNTCGDVLCEDLRAKAMIFQYSRVARAFLQPLPLDEMAAGDNLLSPGGKVWFKKGTVYAAYLPNGGTAQLNLTGETGAFRVRFYDVVNGTYSPTTTVTGGERVSLGVPPFPGDVAVLVER